MRTIYITDKRGRSIRYSSRLEDDFLKPQAGYNLPNLDIDTKLITVNGIGEIDTTNPVLKSISFKSDSVTKDQKIKLKLGIFDESSIEFISVRLRGLKTNRKLPLAARYIDRTKVDAEYLVKSETLKKRNADTYIIESMYLTDFFDNKVRYVCNNNKERPTFKGTDIECPTIDLLDSETVN